MNKWKSILYEMKGNVGMSRHENKKIPTLKTENHSYPHPYIFLCFGMNALFVSGKEKNLEIGEL